MRSSYESSSPNLNLKERLYKGVAIATLGTLGMTGLAACADKDTYAAPTPSVTDTEKPGTTVEPIDTVTPEPTETETTPEAVPGEAPDSTELEISAETLELIDAMREMSAEEFEKLGREQRLMYVDYVLDMHNKYPERYLSPGREEDRVRNPVVSRPSIHDTPDEIVAQHTFVMNSILSQQVLDVSPEDLDEYGNAPLDQKAAQKMLSGAYYYTANDRRITNAYLSQKEYVQNNNTAFSFLGDFIADKASNLTTQQDIYGNSIETRQVEYYDINTYDRNNAIYTFTPYENYKGEQVGMWQILDVPGVGSGNLLPASN